MSGRLGHCPPFRSRGPLGARQTLSSGLNELRVARRAVLRTYGYANDLSLSDFAAEPPPELRDAAADARPVEIEALTEGLRRQAQPNHGDPGQVSAPSYPLGGGSDPPLRS